ncbi:histone-like nucleoid-structuring protein Lsr2 [Candidatus Mycobacterium methanotrophicum]|uniref:Lsr2 family protein n=1 Tax=Candidatus Mycobacterium methanotrophicum TaxID=2943498 RepID=A0ABY4QQS6_9MYCO|nr:Lsr2 family protein [Candidatus Mycobacterium methanotrophicum]UQX13422.1 Lsr2 family protein [Candidatus Mycobacterium methanotrophicum]
MAKKVTVELVDDISGESGATTTQFGLDGIDYEIDLVDDEPLRARLAPWIAKARRLSGRGHTLNGHHRHDSHRIRVWAKANNIPVPRRGKISAATIAAYDKEHSTA